MKYYRTDNLYVGLLGNVTSINNDKQMTIESIDKYIIYTKLYYYYGDMAKDIFTGKVYYFWDGNISTSKTIEKAIGGCAIYTSSPIELYLDSPKKKTSKSELLTILDKLNNQHKEEVKKDEVATQITDSILTTILETSDLVKVTEISEEAKEEFVKELEQLAENYVRDMNSLGNSNNPFKSEYQIRLNYIKALVDIEERIKSPSKIKAYNLKKQLQSFKKELNQVS